MRLNKLLLCLGMLVLCASCGAPKEASFVSNRILKVIGERPPIDKDLATLAPKGLQGATWVNMQATRKSPLWPTLEAVLETHYTDQVFSQQFVLSMLRKSNEILAVSGHRNSDEPDGFVTFIKGTWDTANILEKLSDSGFKKTQIGTKKAMTLMNVVVFTITRQTLAVSTDHLAQPVLALCEQEGDSLRDDVAFKDLEMPVKGGAVARYVRGNSTLNTQQFRGMPSTYRRFAKDMDRIGLKLSISNAIAMRSRITMKNKKQANDVKRRLESEITAIASNPLIKMLGVKSLVNKLKISTKSNDVSLALGLTRNDVQKILQLVEPLMQIRKML